MLFSVLKKAAVLVQWSLELVQLVNFYCLFNLTSTDKKLDFTIFNMFTKVKKMDIYKIQYNSHLSFLLPKLKNITIDVTSDTEAESWKSQP